MSEHELWNELGNLYFLNGHFERAAQAYNKAIALDQNIGEPYNNLALAYEQLGKHAEATEFYRRGIELLTDAHEKALSLHRLGDIHLHQKEYPLAMDAYQQADGLFVESQSVLDTHQQSDFLLHCKPSPIESVDELTDPASSSGMELLPFIEELTPWWFDGQIAPDEEPPAQDAWLEDEIVFSDFDENVVFTDPLRWDVSTAYQGSIVTTMVSSKPMPREDSILESIEPRALEVLEMTMNMFTASEPAQSVTASKKKKRNGAHVETVVTKDETLDVEVITNEPETITHTPDFSTQDTTSVEAVQYNEVPVELPLVELSPEERTIIEDEINRVFDILNKNQSDASAWNSLGRQYKSLNQFEDALGAYQEAVSLDSSNSIYHHDLGLVYAAMGKFDNAITAFETVIEIDPNHCLAHAALGGYYRRNGKEELAQIHIEKAQGLIANDENVYNQACMEAICGNTNRSLELLEIALKNKQTYVNWARKDPDLDFIRADPRFHALLSTYAARAGK